MSRFDIPDFGQATGSYLEDTIFRGSAKALLWHTFTLGALGALTWGSVRMWQDHQVLKGMQPKKEKLPTGGLWGALQPALMANPFAPTKYEVAKLVATAAGAAAAIMASFED
jgi:hypothetical protein